LLQVCAESGTARNGAAPALPIGGVGIAG